MPRQRIYFAGELFDHKHLAGNALLAAAIEAAEPNYECVLPQLMEQPEMRAESIRNHDLLQVLSCDLALFNFDGTELDSGTVVEFMYAKFLDKPCVILRRPGWHNECATLQSDARWTGGEDAWHLH